MKKASQIAIAILIILSACYYDNEEFLYPDINNDCDTTHVDFTSSIQPLLSDNCYSCHSNNTAPSFGNNIALEDYPDVRNTASLVLGSIKHDGTASPMPKNGGKLNSCFITQFELWVSNGMPENWQIP
jgi:hypothetical protein